jgi:cell division protein FtsB
LLFFRLLSPGRILLVAILVVAGYLTFSAGNNFLNSYRLVEDEKRLESEVVRLQEQIGQLEQIRGYLRTDEYVEFMARRVFGLVKPGEQLVVVEAPHPERPADAEDDDLTWWQRLFGGY